MDASTEHDVVVDTADGWTVVCADPQVTQLRFDYRFVLVVASGTMISISERFDLHTPSASWLMQDSDEPGEMAPALVLLRRRIESIEVASSGRLRLGFDHGISVTVGVNDSFENWQIDLPSGSCMVGLPGGGVAHWPKHGAPER